MKCLSNRVLLCWLLLLVAIVSCYCGASPTDGQNVDTVIKTSRGNFRLPKLMDFETFKKEFGKQYSSRVEDLARAKLFVTRALNAMISAIKYKFGQTKYYLGINDMSDLTPEERQMMLGSKPVNLAPNDAPAHVEPVDPIDLEEAKEQIKEIIESNPAPKPLDIDEAREVDGDDHTAEGQAIGGGVADILPGQVKDAAGQAYNTAVSWFFGPPKPVEDTMYIDHRDCLPEPKRQRACGSCYIFAITAMYEWLYCKAHGDKVRFAEQYVIDCGTRAGIKGCKGDYQRPVVSFYSEFGLELEEVYPYKALELECPVNPLISSKFMGRIKPLPLTLQMISSQKLELGLRRAPFPVILKVAQEFQDYGGGVTEGDCQKPDGGYHSMFLVGMGIQDGEEYWLIRNSYGTQWGENGHYKLSRKTTCLNVENNFPTYSGSNVNLKSLFAKNPLYVEEFFKKVAERGT